MPVKCPSCNLMFGTRNELDWHVREEHTRSRVPARTPPAESLATPAGTTPNAVGSARAGPDGPRSADPPGPDTPGTESGGPLAWLRRLFRPSGSGRRPPTSSEPPLHDEQR